MGVAQPLTLWSTALTVCNSLGDEESPYSGPCQVCTEMSLIRLGESGLRSIKMFSNYAKRWTILGIFDKVQQRDKDSSSILTRRLQAGDVQFTFAEVIASSICLTSGSNRQCYCLDLSLQNWEAISDSSSMFCRQKQMELSGWT